MKVRIKKLRSDAILPTYSTKMAAGCDLYAVEPVMIGGANQTVVVSTGIAIELPIGWEAQVRSRSGLAARGISVANSPGTIDEDYRGEIKVILTSNNVHPTLINKGDRIAQMVFTPYYQADFEEVSELSETERGEKGLGSTGN